MGHQPSRWTRYALLFNIEIMNRLTAKHFIIAFVLLGSASFFTYRHGIVAIPREDHRAFMLDHALHESDWQYFSNGAGLMLS